MRKNRQFSPKTLEMLTNYKVIGVKSVRLRSQISKIKLFFYIFLEKLPFFLSLYFLFDAVSL